MAKRIWGWVTTSFERLHNWPDARGDVAYLAHPHRHVFHVRIEFEQFHSQRDVEYITFKKALNAAIAAADFPMSASCEYMATALLDWTKAEVGSDRRVRVTVSEDGENGATVESPV